MNSLDSFTLDVVAVLDNLSLRYVIVSGYVAILFGRSRASEDIDIILEKLDRQRFHTLWDALKNNFECIITSSEEEAYTSESGLALRFARKDSFIPNIEVKFPKDSLAYLSLQKRKKVLLNSLPLYIGPLEVQISYKLFLGSEKDIEDARYLYKLFKSNLNQEILSSANSALKTAALFRRHLQ